ncbi:polysaccharide lyase 8 family protein [Glycomyces algeriensis]|uniref:Lyase n=1 Tax=Glycomyces algeriensis TaxID=256037 RepID=A0A9W6GAX9_9ACTN|nr:polysaccharide lyase 8 family protein [Glycomyces algeriensis]MDA1364721.1 polysaccharide lyase 8 family protein [Glycomyces algeriensis]MDR7350762.1 hyaluronate lyase [Glycomyces algeriensis]GLI43472.1 lyase [Glycomyces algeriensis]
MPNPPSSLNRRLLLGGALGVAGIGVGAGGAAFFLRPDEPASIAASDDLSIPTLDFNGLRARAAELLVGGEFDPSDPEYAPAIARIETEAAELWDTMDRSEGRTAVWPDLDPVSKAANFNNSFRQLYRIATAWATPGTSQYGDEAIAAAIAESLGLLYDEGYNERVEQVDNWYWWEIGSPTALLKMCVILYDHIPAERMQQYFAAVDRWCPDADMRVVNPVIHEVGANRADKAVILALRGILGEDDEKLRLARDGLSGTTTDEGRHSLFQYVTEDDGFYRDGSLIQHDNVPYAAAYGTTLLSSAGMAVSLLAGSAGEVVDENLPVLYDAVELSFEPFLEDGLFMDCVYGRGVSRPEQRDHTNGAAFITALTQLAVGAPPQYRERWHAVVKGWAERSQETFPYAERAGIAGLSRARAILEDDAVAPAPRPEHSRVFAGMDRAVARRADWSWALSMSSNRVAAYEMGNWENLHGWYLGDGMTYLYLRTDAEQYNDEFWPTVDPYRLPGTTVDTREREVTAASEGMVKHLPENDVAGGAALGDRYAVAAMELVADGSSLRAKKAWFVLDDAVVALGADITASDGRTVVTTVENRNLGAEGSPRLSVNGDEQSSEPGWAAELDDARWIHLEGVGGYLFPSGAEGLRGLRETRTGAWNDIEQGPTTGGGDTEVHSRRYATLWFDHGTSPAAATYAYVLLPTADESATATAAGSDRLQILANTPAVQAVTDGSRIAAHFWQAGEAGGLTCDGPASVLVAEEDGEYTVAIADPGRTTSEVVVELSSAASEVLEADDTVTVETGDRPRITVRTEGSLGATHTVRLR